MTQDQSSKKIELKASTQLMKNQKAAQVMPAQTSFRALQTANGQALFFSISDDGDFYLSAETPGARTGWSPYNLSSDLSKKHDNKKITAKAFAVAQHPANQTITMALAVNVEKETGDHLYVVTGLSDQPGADWHSAPGKRQWHARPFDDKDHPMATLDLAYLHLPMDRDPSEEPLMLAGIRSEKTSYIQNYTVNTNPSVNSGIWKVLQTAENYTSMMDMHIGRPAGQMFPGLYQLYGLEKEIALTFTPLKSLYGPPSILKLTPPKGASALAVNSPDEQGQTALLIAGESAIYLYPADKQNNFATGIPVIQNEIISGVKELSAHASPKETIIWGLNATGQVFYARCDRGEEQDSNAWSYPVPIQENTSQIASLLDRRNNSNRIFAHTGQQELVHLNQDPVTSLWRQGSILLPHLSADDGVEFYTYTTHIQVEDENRLPIAGTTFKISSTSPCHVFLNDSFASLSRETPIEIKTDATGGATIVQQVHTLGAVSYFLHHPDSSTINVNPMSSLITTMDGVTSGKQLGQIKIKDEVGKERFLVPNSTSPDTKEAIAQSLQQFVKTSKSLPRDGSSIQVKKSDPARLLKRSLEAANSGHTWGMSFEEGIALYHEGEAVELLARPWTESPGAAGIWDAVELAAGDIFRWLKHAWGDVKNFFIKVVDDITHFFIQLGEKLYRFIVKCISDVVHAVEFVFNKIKVFFKDLVEWLGFIFQWESFIRTKNVIKNIIKQYIPYAVSRLPEYKKNMDGAFKEIESKINQWAGLKNVEGSVAGFSADSRPMPGKDSPEANWGIHHLKSNARDIKIKSPGTLAATASTADQDTLKELLEEILHALEKEGKIFQKAFNTIKTQIADQIDTLDAGDVIKRLLAVLADTLLESVENILDTFLDILQILVRGLPQVLDATIEIPVISWLYKEITGSDLSFLDLCCLVAAIPTTIIFKLMMGLVTGEKREPFPDNSFTKALIDASSFQEIRQLYRNQALMKRSTGAVAQNSLSREQIDLELAFYLVSFWGSAGFMFTSIFKAETPGDKTISIANGIGFYLATGSSLTASLIDSTEQTPWQILSETIYGFTIIQKFADIFSYNGESSYNMKQWTKASKWMDFGLGIPGLLLTIPGLVNTQTGRSITAFLGGIAWNVNRILSPFADLNKTPEVFAIKMACILAYGITQPIQAGFAIHDNLAN